MWAKSSVIPTSVHTHVSTMQNEVQTLYDTLVTDGYFENVGIKNAGVTFDFTHDRELLLYLVEWLEQRGDEQSKKLLTKINNLFYLKFHQLLSRVDTQQRQQQNLLINNLRTLYTHRVGAQFPFQTMLTKTMLQLAVASEDSVSYSDSQSSMLLILQQTQTSLIRINTALASNKIDEHIIKELVNGLAHYVLVPEKESAFVGVGSKIITAVIVVASIVVVMAVGYYLIKRLMASRDVQMAINSVNNVVDAINRVNQPNAPVVQALDGASNAINNASGAINNASGAVNNASDVINGINQHNAPVVQALGGASNAINNATGAVNNVSESINGINQQNAPIIVEAHRAIDTINAANNLAERVGNGFPGRLFLGRSSAVQPRPEQQQQGSWLGQLNPFRHDPENPSLIDDE